MRKGKDKVRDLAEEMAYELHVRRKIAAGLKAADEGRLVPHEEVKRRFLPIEEPGDRSRFSE